MTAVVSLARGKDAALRRRHPWIFSGAIDSVEGEPASGDTVRVHSSAGEFLAWGAYSPKSQIRVRAWSFDEDQPPDADWLRSRLDRAAEWRAPLLAADRSAARLVHGEADGLPGLIIDQYGVDQDSVDQDSVDQDGVDQATSVAVVQFLAAGAEKRRHQVIEWLRPRVATVFERSDTEARQKEGLQSRAGVVAGAALPEALEIVEDGRRFQVDVAGGHKTGFYLDQRPNRALLAGLLAQTGGGAEVLDVFCYTGGFSVAAASAGAGRLTQIDASGAALEMARRHVRMADFSGQLEQIEGNAFGELRRLRAEQRQFDVVVLDPPKFADTKARVERASRGYKDINLLAFQLLRAGGHLLTFSCSGRVGAELFGKIVASAASDARRDVQVISRLDASPDHPVSLAFPEGAYLKGLLCRVA